MVSSNQLERNICNIIQIELKIPHVDDLEKAHFILPTFYLNYYLGVNILTTNNHYIRTLFCATFFFFFFFNLVICKSVNEKSWCDWLHMLNASPLHLQCNVIQNKTNLPAKIFWFVIA